MSQSATTGRGLRSKAGSPHAASAPGGPDKPTHRKGLRILAVILLLAAACCAANIVTKHTISVSRYTIETPKLTAPVRIAVIADLHNSQFGPNQRQLLAAVAAESPDLILLLGDIFHAETNEEYALEALTSLGSAYDCYFVIGNHEGRSQGGQAYKQIVRTCGITVLDAKTGAVTIAGQSLQLFGLDYIRGGKPTVLSQLAPLSKQLDETLFSILLCHCPDDYTEMLTYGFDLMLSGHTHGGQWRVPFAKNGLFAPGQGFLPKFAGGRFDQDSRTLIVSRGLSKKPWFLPRFGNPPELVIVELS